MGLSLVGVLMMAGTLSLPAIVEAQSNMWSVVPQFVGFLIFLFVFLFVWIRATLPRLRYDQLMSFGWKVLLPLATLNALVTAIVVVAVS